jgi:hypothetical protein
MNTVGKRSTFRHRGHRSSTCEIYGIVPQDVRMPYEVREIIARIVDDLNCMSSSHSTARHWSAASPVWEYQAILASNGVLLESALKGAHGRARVPTSHPAVPAEHFRFMVGGGTKLRVLPRTVPSW